MSSFPFDLRPVNPRRDVERRLAVSMLGCGIEQRSATYVSAPITSGLRLARWLNMVDARSNPPSPERTFSKEQLVLEPNLVAAREAVQRVRASTSSTVIDPTRLMIVPDWSQTDYHWVWGEVIRTYVAKVVAVDDWMYSTGCVYEFAVADEESIPVYALDGTVVSREEGAALVLKASAQLSEMGAPSESLAAVAKHLSQRSAGTRVS